MSSTAKDGYISIGMTASLTGRYAYPGRQALIGVQAWIQDTNVSGGIRLGVSGPQLPVRLVYYDDASEGLRCAEVARQLIVEDRVDILMGPYSSGLSLRAATVAQRHGRILWNQGGASESIYTSGSEWVVGVLTPASMYFHGVLEMVRQRCPSAGKVAIVHSTAGAFPKDVASGAAEHSRALGFDTVCAHPYGAGTKDFGPILSRLNRDRPDVVLAVGRIEDDIRFAQQFVESDASVPAVALIVTPLALFKDALGEQVDGFLGPSQWEPNVVKTPDFGPSSPDVVRSLRAKGHSAVDYPMAQAYAGCLVAQRCIEEAGSLDQSAVWRAAGQLDFTTFYGRFLIDSATGRQIGHRMPVVRWERGEKAVVWPHDAADRSEQAP